MSSTELSWYRLFRAEGFGPRAMQVIWKAMQLSGTPLEKLFDMGRDEFVKTFPELGKGRLKRANFDSLRGQDEDALWRLVPHDISMFIYLFDESPVVISTQGSSYLQPDFVDVVFVTVKFDKALAHVHASWLDPSKIRQLTVVGSKKMAVFDDMVPEYKLQKSY